MRFRHIGSDEITLWIPVTIPAKNLVGFLLGTDKARYIEFDIQIRVIARPCWGEWLTEYTGQWATPPVGNYPARILDAINNYLNSINVTETFKKEIRTEIE